MGARRGRGARSGEPAGAVRRAHRRGRLLSPLFVAAVPAELGDLPGEALGIGLVAAAVSAGRLLSERRPSRVVLVGTAGVFPGRAPTVGSVVIARRLGLGAAAVTLGLGYQPGAPPVLTADAADLPGSIPACLPADVLTNLAITTSPDLAARFAADWEVEHMETFGVAWACHAAGVPFAAVLGITNTVGPDAHAEWLRHRSAAESAARAAARALVAAPANC